MHHAASIRRSRIHGTRFTSSPAVEYSSVNGTGERFAIGDVLFAPANAPHKFLDFTDDFAVWVLFIYGPEGGER